MCMRKVPKMVPQTPTKMAKKWQKSVKKCCGEAGSPGSPGQGRGEFSLARGIVFPGFPAIRDNFRTWQSLSDLAVVRQHRPESEK